MRVTYNKHHTSSSLNWNLSQNKECNATTNYISSKQLSDVLAKRKSSKRNVEMDTIAVIFIASFPITITYPYKNEICNVTVLKTDTYAKYQCSLFQDECRVWVERMSDWDVQIRPSQVMLQWCLSIFRCFYLGTNVLDIVVSIVCV